MLRRMTIGSRTDFRSGTIGFLLTLWLCPSIWAQSPADRIEDILVVGNRRIQESTISYYIQTQKSGSFDRAQILRDFRSLLNTNFFEDITVKTRQGDTGIIVIFEVRERPLVRHIEYTGMKSFKESDVLEKFRDLRVGLTVDSPFDQAKIPKARSALRALLDENGRPLARIETEIEEITSSSIKLTFLITEGPKVRIGKIDFRGNTVLSSDQLRGSLELNKERGPIVLFKGKDKFIQDKLDYDVQVNLLEAYRAIGYINSRAGQADVEIVEGPRGMLLGFRKTKQQYYITIPIEEGEQYTYGTFQLEGASSFDPEALRLGYPIQQGAVVNYTALKEANENIKKLYATRGFLDMDAIPNLQPNTDDKTLDVAITIIEGKQYIVDKIEFSGNTRTRDKVLRREMFIEEQSAFNGQLLEVSITRLNQLGFFEPIQEENYEVIKKPDEGSADVVVSVKEKSVQSIGFTGGVSGYSGTFIGINYSTNNFRGMGQTIGVQLSTGTRSSNYFVRYTDPYFRDSKVTLSLSVFNTQYRFDTFTASFGAIDPDQAQTLFTRGTTGFEIGGSYPWRRWTRLGLSYTLSNIRIDDINPAIENLALRQLIGFTPGGDPQEAKNGIIRSEIRPSYTRNTKNSFFQATSGASFFAQISFAGGPLGGSYNLIRPWVEYQKFIPDRWLSGGRHTFAFRVRAQHLWPYGKLSTGGDQTVPFFERVFLGGEFDLRGFEIRSVSPLAITRNAITDSGGSPLIDPGTGLPTFTSTIIPIGGDTSVVGTFEYRVPIAGPLTLTGFADVGTSAILRETKLTIFGPETVVQLLPDTNGVIRASTGAEIQFLMPMLNQPFRFIMAYNPLVMKTDVVLQGRTLRLEEKRTNFRFTVGYTF